METELTRCILLRTRDRRHFLAPADAGQDLQAFCEAFRAKMTTVLADPKKILSLRKLAKAICNQEAGTEPLQVQYLEGVPSGRNRQDLLKNAKKVRRHIRSALLNKQPVSLSDLSRKFKSLGVTTACLCHHFSCVRQEMQEEGRPVEKTGRGEYQLAEPD